MEDGACQLAQRLAQQPLPPCAALTPFQIVEVSREPSFLRVLFDPQPAFENHFGNVQGGFSVAMLDVLISLAAFAHSGVWQATVEMKANFLRPLPVAPIEGEGRMVKQGRQFAFAEARLLVGELPAVTCSATLVGAG